MFRISWERLIELFLLFILLINSNVIYSLWQYAKKYGLQDGDDPRYIKCDDALKKVFNLSRIGFPQLPDLLNLHFFAPDPVVLEYTIRVDKEYHIGQYAFDVEVEVDDPSTKLMRDFITDNPPLMKELALYNEKISALLLSLTNLKTKRDFFLSYSLDPCGFIKKWISSQNRDLEVILGDCSFERQDVEKGEFYDKGWVSEAVFRYINEQSRR